MMEEAQAEVDSTRSALPRELRAKAAGIPVTFEHVPSHALMRDGIEPDTLGLFVGSPFTEEGDDPLPPQIILYLDNIWDQADRDPKEYRFQIRQTLLHELGHYLGLDEEDLQARDLE
jgi:predicted Zn-dependent protease with MMP-like domain